MDVNDTDSMCPMSVFTCVRRPYFTIKTENLSATIHMHIINSYKKLFSYSLQRKKTRQTEEGKSSVCRVSFFDVQKHVNRYTAEIA